MASKRAGGVAEVVQESSHAGLTGGAK
jgi:hypothetical protein